MSDEGEVVPMFLRPPAGEHSPVEYAARLLEDPEHSHIKDAELALAFLMRVEPKEKGGKRVLGAVHVPAVQGQLSDLFDQMLYSWFGVMPDFLVVLDAQWWADASEDERNALLWHELSHIKPAMDRYGAPRLTRDGLPVFKLVEHDVAAFRSEVARYGAWSQDLREFIGAVRADT